MAEIYNMYKMWELRLGVKEHYIHYVSGDGRLNMRAQLDRVLVSRIIHNNPMAGLSLLLSIYVHVYTDMATMVVKRSSCHWVVNGTKFAHR